jgi:hypothetical protein
MTAPVNPPKRADALPLGSVVAVKAPNGPFDSSARVYLKTGDDGDLPWIYYEQGSMYVNNTDDEHVQDEIDDGADVLREGP